MATKTMGRNKITIDWEEVDKFLMAGCSGQQVADTLGICNDTLFNRCNEVHKMTFSDYSAKKRRKGNSYLHAKQYQVAMGGNVSMLIWLGKQRLQQTDQPLVKQEFNGSLASLLDVMHLVKTSDDFDALVKLAKDNKKEKK